RDDASNQPDLESPGAGAPLNPLFPLAPEGGLFLALAEGVAFHAGVGDLIQHLAMPHDMRTGRDPLFRDMGLQRPMAVRLPAGQALEPALRRRHLISAAIAAVLALKGQNRPYGGGPLGAARGALLIAGQALEHSVQRAGRHDPPLPQRRE